MSRQFLSEKEGLSRSMNFMQYGRTLSHAGFLQKNIEKADIS